MITEILMIVVGIALVIAGYVIPSKKEKTDSSSEKISRDQIQEMVAEEMEAAKGQISDVVDETITYAMEKTERSMDRLSNEKMMAVSEYSDSVLEQIGKSHEEVVFLYDMLNDKHENLKETVAEAARTADQVKEKLKEAEDLTPIVVSKIQERKTAEVSESIPAEEPEIPQTAKKEKSSRSTKTRNKPVPVIKADQIEPEKETEETQDEEEDDSLWEEEWDDFDEDDDFDGDGPDINFSSRSPGSRNNNDRILELHKAGKSNMAIAKELGLGVGEVKLVIDLFKGGKS